MRNIWLLLAIMATEPARSQDSLQEVRDASKRIIPENYGEWPDEKRISWLEQKIPTNVIPAEIYALKRVLFNEKALKNDNKAATDICLNMNMLQEDLALRVRCIEAADGILPHDEAKRHLLEILYDARRLDSKGDAVDALASLAWIQSQDGDISEALASYGEALEIVPKGDERTRNNILFNLATNYIVHGNEDYMRKGIALLQEIKTRGAPGTTKADQEQAALLLEDSRLAAFNIGIAYTLHLHDYEKAIKEFDYAKARATNRAEALTFSALAAAALQRTKQAQQFIAEIKGEAHPNPIKEAYLTCYRALAVRHWDSRNSLESCFQLHPDTTLEVVADVNRRLSLLKGHPEEMQGLRAHMQMYENRIKPEYKKRAAKAASNTELKRLETEAKLKDEKIALGEKIRILLYVVLLISSFLLGLMLIIMRSRRIIKAQAQHIHQQKARLQNVLNNMDEGIVTIDQNAQISSVYSAHAVQILQKEPDQMNLPELLAKLGLARDGLTSAQSVFGAVLGEEQLAWELNEGLLPQSGSIHGRPFLFSWSPIVRRGRITEVILSMRDASAALALKEEEHARDRIIALVHAGVIGENFIANLVSRLRDIRRCMNAEGVSHGLRLAHTMKGEARSLGFTELLDQLHLFEQSMLQHDFLESQGIMDRIEDAAQGLSEAAQLLGNGDRRSSGHPVLDLCQTIMTDAQRRLQEAGIDLASEIHLDWMDLCDEEISALRDIMIHGIANAIDHGYLMARKKNLPCSSLAHIAVQVSLKGEDIHVSVLDQGAGIDWKTLQEIARKRNWTPPAGSNLADIVFLDKVSTVPELQVSKTSGRGLGMAAVAEAVKSLQGSIQFGPGAQGRGARLDIKWKHRASRQAKAAS